jgi:hypothetical protein
MHEVDTHSRSPDLADDRSRAFSIVLIGNQIAESVRTQADLIALDIVSRNPCSVTGATRGGGSGICPAEICRRGG